MSQQIPPEVVNYTRTKDSFDFKLPDGKLHRTYTPEGLLASVNLLKTLGYQTNCTNLNEKL